MLATLFDALSRSVAGGESDPLGNGAKIPLPVALVRVSPFETKELGSDGHDDISHRGEGKEDLFDGVLLRRSTCHDRAMRQTKNVEGVRCAVGKRSGSAGLSAHSVRRCHAKLRELDALVDNGTVGTDGTTIRLSVCQLQVPSPLGIERTQPWQSDSPCWVKGVNELARWSL